MIRTAKNFMMFNSRIPEYFLHFQLLKKKMFPSCHFLFNVRSLDKKK